jgi:hypothetical protein
MEKQSFVSLIDKYYLNGVGEKVRWSVKDGIATIKTFSATKDMVGVVTGAVELVDSEFVIFDTSKFLKLVGICNQFLTTDIQFQGNIATKLLVADNEYNLEYALANLMLAPQVNFTVEEFESDYSFAINNDFINKWIKAKKALNSDLCTMQQITKDDSPIIEFTLGEPEGHSNKITFEEVPAAHKPDSIPQKLQFNAEYLKSIFDANYGADGIMYVNNEGAMKLEFESEDGQKSSYVILAKV